MTEKLLIDFIILSVAFGSAFVIIGYEDHARVKGWPLGSWLAGDAPFLKILAIVTMLTALGIAFYVYKWWSPLIVFVLGFVFGFFATGILKSRVQLFAIIGAVIGWFLCLTYVL